MSDFDLSMEFDIEDMNARRAFEAICKYCKECFGPSPLSPGCSDWFFTDSTGVFHFHYINDIKDVVPHTKWYVIRDNRKYTLNFADAEDALLVKLTYS